MITIINVGPFSQTNPLGVHTYEVRINNKTLTSFEHRRSDGLGTCLTKASQAIEHQKRLDEASSEASNLQPA